MKKKVITPALKFFFRKLEKKSDENEAVRLVALKALEEVPFEEIEKFIRSIKSQNIFIYTVGSSGKPVSMLLEKAIFSLNKVIRIYYSTSFDEENQGYVRIQVNNAQKLILVERLHGERPVPVLMYASRDECHVIRFITRWLVRRIDWDKTKLDNLELYKRYLENQREEIEARLAEEEAIREEREIQVAYEKHFGKTGENHKIDVKGLAKKVANNHKAPAKKVY